MHVVCALSVIFGQKITTNCDLGSYLFYTLAFCKVVYKHRVVNVTIISFGLVIADLTLR